MPSSMKGSSFMNGAAIIYFSNYVLIYIQIITFFSPIVPKSAEFHQYIEIQILYSTYSCNLIWQKMATVGLRELKL